MRLPSPVRDNLLFLLAETSSQIGDLQLLLETSSPSVSQRILDRRGYSYNLKMRIHDDCIQEVRRTKAKEASETYTLRAAEAIASELERMSDLVHDCVLQLSGRKRRGIFRTLSSAKLLDDVLGGIQLTRFGLDEDNTKTAVRIADVSRKVCRKYEVFFQRESRGFRKAKHSRDVIGALFVAQRLNEMGAILLGISEAIISARLGHPLNMDRFRFLESAFEDLGIDGADVDSIADTKSGSGISGIANGKQEGYAAIIKDGKKKKLQEERQSVKNWHEIFPGLAPQILSYRKRGANASLLIEHLPGFTFEQVLLSGSDSLLATTFKHLARTLKAVWRETKRPEGVKAQHMVQLRKRMDGVREIHADLIRGKCRVGNLHVNSLAQLIRAAEKRENAIESPFSVFIHGDFNLDNVIFDPAEKRIKFIDLHRSCYADYVQDASVFMVSNYRLQALDGRTRSRITSVAVKFYRVAAKFARHNDDDTFELRLAFGLARSFISSTRFILDKSLANAMYLRGAYILERVLEQNKKSYADFRLPIKELFT